MDIELCRGDSVQADPAPAESAQTHAYRVEGPDTCKSPDVGYPTAWESGLEQMHARNATTERCVAEGLGVDAVTVGALKNKLTV